MGRELSEREQAALNAGFVLERWKVYLKCAVCDRSLAREPVLYEVVLPYRAKWKYPSTSWSPNYLLRVGLPCLCCHAFPDGPDGKFAVAFLCHRHININYVGLLGRITHAVQITSLRCRPGLPKQLYDPERVRISYVPVRCLRISKRLVRALPDLRKILPEKECLPEPEKRSALR